MAGSATQLRMAGGGTKILAEPEAFGPNSMGHWDATSTCPSMSLWIVLSYFTLALFYSISFGICNSNAGGNYLSINGFHDVNQELILFLKIDPKLL